MTETEAIQAKLVVVQTALDALYAQQLEYIQNGMSEEFWNNTGQTSTKDRRADLDSVIRLIEFYESVKSRLTAALNNPSGVTFVR